MLYYIFVGLLLFVATAEQMEVKRSTLEQRVQQLENELEHGGKEYQTVSYNSKLHC